MINHFRVGGGAGEGFARPGGVGPLGGPLGAVGGSAAAAGGGAGRRGGAAMRPCVASTMAASFVLCQVAFVGFVFNAHDTRRGLRERRAQLFQQRLRLQQIGVACLQEEHP